MPRPDGGWRGRGPGRSRRPGDGPRYSRSYYRARERAAAARPDPAGPDTARLQFDPPQRGRPQRGRSGADRRQADRGRPAGASRLGSSLTSRAAVLGLAVCALVLSLAYPAKQYLAQRSAVAALAHQKAAAEQRVAVLSARDRQLRDPAYLRTLARQRLQYVMPGDRVYIVVSPSHPPTPPAATAPVPAADPAQPWFARLWGSVRSADSGPVEATAAPGPP